MQLKLQSGSKKMELLRQGLECPGLGLGLGMLLKLAHMPYCLLQALIVGLHLQSI